MTVVLDSYALIALVQGEAGAVTVRNAVEAGDARVSWINLGEVYYVLARRVGNDLAHQIVLDAQQDCRVEAPDGRLVLDAARIKTRGRIAYADCFAVAMARRDGLPLLTGDPEILALADELEVVDLRSVAHERPPSTICRRPAPSLHPGSQPHRSRRRTHLVARLTRCHNHAWTKTALLATGTPQFGRPDDDLRRRPKQEDGHLDRGGGRDRARDPRGQLRR